MFGSLYVWPSYQIVLVFLPTPRSQHVEVRRKSSHKILKMCVSWKPLFQGRAETLIHTHFNARGGFHLECWTLCEMTIPSPIVSQLKLTLIANSEQLATLSIREKEQSETPKRRRECSK
uniref:Uncharacterized protein n=1 Tax=Cacopsylla melanoneura TaxID=428564 RepID=A0A8D8XHX2_9HEMI